MSRKALATMIKTADKLEATVKLIAKIPNVIASHRYI